MTSEFETLQTKYNNLVSRSNEQAEYIEVADMRMEQQDSRIDELELLLAMAQNGASCEE